MTAILISGAMVWDGVSDEARPAAVIVEGDKISKVIDPTDLPSEFSGEEIDGGGMTLMPGMIEGHCHPSFTGVGEPPELGRIPAESA